MSTFITISLYLTTILLIYLGGKLLRWVYEPIALASKRLNESPSLEEGMYKDLIQNEIYHEFPSLADPATKSLSVIIPACDEKDRIGPTLKSTFDYLQLRASREETFTYEIIVVDDGSIDNTSDYSRTFVRQYNQYITNDTFRILTLCRNEGKGSATRKGFLRARGEYIIFIDADNATNIQELDKMISEMDQILYQEKKSTGIIIGSRAHLEKQAIAKRKPLRNLLMHGLHFLVATLCVRGIRDTQCGFKLFHRQAAKLIFVPLHLERWAFDVELLYIAQHYHIPVKEVAVEWTEMPGSKMNLINASLTMLRELFLIPLCYQLGIWKFQDGTHRLKIHSKSS